MQAVVTWLHIMGVITVFAGATVSALNQELALRRTECHEIAALLEGSRAGARVVIYGTGLLGAAGLTLPWLGGWGYSKPWVVASIVLFSMVIVISAVGGHRPKRARVLARALADEGRAPTPELFRLLNDRTATFLNYLSGTILVGIVYIMVAKP